MYDNTHIQTVGKNFSRSRERELSISGTFVRLNVLDYKGAEQSDHEKRSNWEINVKFLTRECTLRMSHNLCHMWWYIRVHTYIIGHYNPSVRIIDLVSHTTFVVFVNFIPKWRDLHLKIDSEWHIFLRNFSWQF